jgi:uncharacterized RDD family membrane protein YckC|tara:strand:+ start:961 stop:1437 length:477 start_codon:yes stop_codon:yes gene_type:complete
LNDSDVIYVGFWIRFLAFLIDSIIATIAITPLVSTLIGETLVTNYDLQDNAQMMQFLSDWSLQLGLELLFMATIFILFWTIKSATPGKMLFGAYIVDAKTLGKASPKQNVIRYLGYYVSMIPLFLGFLWIALDKRKQGWHDKFAGTLVIKGKPREPHD